MDSTTRSSYVQRALRAAAARDAESEAETGKENGEGPPTAGVPSPEQPATDSAETTAEAPEEAPAPATSEAEESPATADAQTTDVEPTAAEPQAADADDEEEDGAGDVFDMDAHLSDMGTLRRGDIVTGVVAQIGREGVLVDIGRKAEGLIPPDEFAGDPEEELSVGDSVDAYVLKPETEEGNALLSKRRADYERMWQEILTHHKEGTVVRALVRDRVKGGLIVDIGVDGFVPASHVFSGEGRRRRPTNLDRFVGNTLRLKIIEVDRKRRKVVLSHRLVIEQERRERKQKLLEELEEGKVVSGVVRRLTNYGAFVDIGGMDGLLHVSEMAWTRVERPSDVLKPGQKIQVVVLRWDPEQERISLGLKQLLPDPWKQQARRLKTGQVVKVKITRTFSNGAFGMLENGLEGIIPIGELADRHIKEPTEVVQPGQEVDVRIINIQPRQRRLTLSLRQAVQERDRQQVSDYMRSQDSGNVTLGDVFGDLLNDAVERPSSGPQTAKEDAPETEESSETSASQADDEHGGTDDSAPAPTHDAESSPQGDSEDAEV